MKIYLYILNTLADWEIGYITAEINSQRYLDKSKGDISLIKIGNTKESIKTMGGILITPDEIIDNIRFNEGDVLILPGGDTWMNEENQRIINIVSEIITTKVIVAAICGATFALAQAKLFDNRRHTSNSKDFLKISCPEYSGSDYYVNEPICVDDNLITATGLAPLEFSYEIFKKANIMKEETLNAWYYLHKTKEEKYFYQLMDSLK